MRISRPGFGQAYLQCEEKARLRVLCRDAIKLRNKAVNDVLLVRGRATKEEYHRLRALADDARAGANRARQALEQHKDAHGC